MRIDVRVQGMEPSGALREHALRRIRFRLSRFGREISTVTARIDDVNGPRGGLDKRCQVTVRGRRFGALTVRELSGDAYAAFDTTLERVGRAVTRTLERERSTRLPRSLRRRAS